MFGAELICAVLLIAGPQVSAPGPAVAAPVPATHSPQPAPTGPSTRTVATPDGRTAQLADLGAPGGGALLDRIAGELPSATAAVTAFWGPQWPRDIPIVVAGTTGQFATLGGGGDGIAATTTAQRITFAPGATAMDDADLRTVVRHELFHYAARADTAADAPVWFTEGVADYVARPPAATPPAAPRGFPSDAEMAAPGPARDEAYDRAWEFASYVAGVYGEDTLRALYVAACGHGHADFDGAVRTVLGVEPASLWADS